MIIGVSGKARHGKDTVVDIATAFYEPGQVQRIAFADAIREEAKAAGVWDGIVPYTPEGRTVLQAFGFAKRQEDPDYWVRKALVVCQKSPEKVFVIPDTRFINEADAIRDAGGVILRVERREWGGEPFDNGLTDEQKTHPSETQLDNYPWDEWVRADNVRMLSEKVQRFLSSIPRPHSPSGNFPVNRHEAEIVMGRPTDAPYGTVFTVRQKLTSVVEEGSLSTYVSRPEAYALMKRLEEYFAAPYHGPDKPLWKRMGFDIP